MNGQPAWSRGYPVGSPYPPAWHFFQSPAHLRAICALMGTAWEVDETTPLSIAEIGCGTGYTACVLAAGNPSGTVLGIDHNPAQIAEARSLAKAAGLDNARFLEADLAELGDSEVDALPAFDLVMVHGVWSWVSDPVRSAILRLVRRRLKAGGVALVTYNALPGAAAGLGLARLVRKQLLKANDPVDALPAARRLVERLADSGATHLLASSWRRLLTGEATGAADAYLVHEFLTENWRPSFFEDVADAMASARCEFVGSATIDENFPHLSLDTAQQDLWAEAGDLRERQLILDTCVRRAFRRDVFVRGMRPVSRRDAVDALRLAATSRASGEVRFSTQAGVASLPADQIGSIRERLAAAPASIGELRQIPGCERLTPEELLAMLIGSGCAVPLWRMPATGADWQAANAGAKRLNAVAAARFAPHGVAPMQLALASPALAGGLSADGMDLAVAARLNDSPRAPSRWPEPGEIVRGLLPAGARPEPEVMADAERRVAAILQDRAPAWAALDLVPRLADG